MSETDALFTAKQVCEIAGGVTPMTLWRWARDPRVGFPAPTHTINKRRYWAASVIRAWQDRMAARPAVTTPAGGRYREAAAQQITA